MKNLLLLCYASAFFISSCASESSLTNQNAEDSTITDNGVAGTYIGNLPCADCPFIKYKLILNADSTYEESREYQDGGNPTVIKNQGTWRFKTFAMIQLMGKEENNNSLFDVGNGELRMLDAEGQVISEPTKDLYVLRKQ